MKASSLKPPVVKQDINAANLLKWGNQPLGAHIGDLERMLMLDVDAPVAYDAMLFREKKERSQILVNGFKKSLPSNPALKPIVMRIGEALIADRKERLELNASSEPQRLQEAVQSITRQSPAKNTYPPRG